MVFALSVHAGYACRHSGACCTAGWHIPVEPRLRPLLNADVLVPDARGACFFHDAAARRCRIHHDHGESMLPAACRHFPRRALLDDRGIFVSLSHFCPTAAALLVDDDRPLTIVERPPAFPDDREYEGLDARGAWPPLVRPGVLFDLESYSVWESFLVRAFASGGTARLALASIIATAEKLRQWTSHQGPFRDWVVAACAAGHPAGAGMPGRYAMFEHAGVHQHVQGMVPPELMPDALPDGAAYVLNRFVEPQWERFAGPVRRYLAAKAFASWGAYQARGVRTLVAELIVAEAVLKAEATRACASANAPLNRELLIAAIRQADLLLVHLVDRQALTAFLGGIETRAEEAVAPS